MNHWSLITDYKSLIFPIKKIGGDQILKLFAQHTQVYSANLKLAIFFRVPHREPEERLSSKSASRQNVCKRFEKSLSQMMYGRLMALV